MGERDDATDTDVTDVEEQDQTDTAPEGDDAPAGPADDGKDTKPADDKPKPRPRPADTVSRADYNALAAQLRKATQSEKAKQAELDKIAEANASEAEKAQLAARKEGAAETEARLRPAVARSAARVELAAAGCTDKAAQTLMLRLLDTSSVELDDAGDVVGGLEEQIEVLKGQFPEKFETARRRVPSAREVDAGDKKPPAAKKSATDLLMSRLTGGGKG